MYWACAIDSFVLSFVLPTRLGIEFDQTFLPRAARLRIRKKGSGRETNITQGRVLNI